MRQFRGGEELCFAREPAEMVDLVQDLLGDRARAVAMGRRGRERVLAEHTYAHRAATMLGLLARGPQAAVACSLGSTPTG
jgi:spore maturation protein CgeB